MIRQMFSALALAITALAFTACDQLQALNGPTHSYVLVVDQEALEESGRKDADVGKLIEDSIPVLAERLVGFGVIIHGYTLRSSNELVIELSGSNHRQAVETAAGGNVDLMIAAVDTTVLLNNVQAGIAPPGSIIVPGGAGQLPMAVKRFGSLSGRNIETAQTGVNEQSNQPVINVMFDDLGAKKFGRLSAQHVGQAIAIIIDGETVSAPIVNEPVLGGMVQISGGFTEKEANELAVMLASGGLPAPLKIAEVSAID